jgi:alpha-glucosidase
VNRKTRNLLLIGLPIVLIALGIWLGWRARFSPAGPVGKLTADPAAFPSATYRVGDFSVRWDAGARQFTVESPSRPGFALWQTLPGRSFVQAAQGTETVREARGMFRIRDTLTDSCGEQSILSMQRAGEALEVSGRLRCRSGREIPYSLVLESPEPNRLDLRLRVEANRAFLTYASSWEDRFFGFGEQFSYVDMRGRRVPIWVSEQGVGRGDQPITLGANVTNDGAGGTPFTTYAPVPFYMTSSRRALALLNTEYTVFDLRGLNRVQIEVFSDHIHAVLLDGSSPKEILTHYTDITGRPRPLPDWVHSGAIVGMQGGTEKVRQVYQALKARGTPIAAFWLQDWVGQRKTTFGSQLWWNWEVDEERYPNWDDLVQDLKADGVRVMVYVNPNLVDVSEKPNARRNLFQEALEKGYLVRRPDGSPYLLLNTSFYYGMVDLTNPEAVAWLKDVIREQVVGAGASGWMADFAEALPYDAVLASGDARVLHNQWPVLWAELNREVVEESGGDQVFFTRAGFTGSQGASTLFWEGDQLVSWGRHDGIKSAVTGLNSSGLSGFPFNHSDTGGYTTVSNPIMTYHRSEELLLRWMEMNAFTLIFRTHEGNQPEQNVQFYSSDATLDAFARWAKVYAALFEYRKQLIEEASRTGLPVVRHPFLQYPGDPGVWGITYQEFMLGPDFLIAPVTEAGAKRVKVYLPCGEWVHLWSGRTYMGCQQVTVDAPIGQPAVFYVKGSRWGEDLVRRLREQGLMP